MTASDLIDKESQKFKDHQNQVENELVQYFSKHDPGTFAKFNRAEIIEFITFRELRKRYSRASDADVFAKVNLVYRVPEISETDINNENVDEILEELEDSSLESRE